MKSAFIISPSYSGSTLLSMLLAHHPGLSTLGEYLDNHSRRYRKGEGDFCSCGERLPDCPYMMELTKRITAGGTDFSIDYPDTAFFSESPLASRVLRAYIRGPVFESMRHLAIKLVPDIRNTIKRVAARNTAVISSILEMDNSTVYLDSAKNNNRVIFLEKYAPEIEVKVIWLIRDGRGVATFIMRHTGVDMATAAQRWATTQGSVIRTTEDIPDTNIFTLRYEDLCSDPHRWLPEVCRFLELDPELLPDAYGEQEQHLTGNNMRLKGLSEIKIDERWKNNLSQEELQTFSDIAGPLNKQLGYSSA